MATHEAEVLARLKARIGNVNHWPSSKPAALVGLSSSHAYYKDSVIWDTLNLMDQTYSGLDAGEKALYDKVSANPVQWYGKWARISFKYRD